MQSSGEGGLAHADILPFAAAADAAVRIRAPAAVGGLGRRREFTGRLRNMLPRGQLVVPQWTRTRAVAAVVQRPSTRRT